MLDARCPELPSHSGLTASSRSWIVRVAQSAVIPRLEHIDTKDKGFVSSHEPGHDGHIGSVDDVDDIFSMLLGGT